MNIRIYILFLALLMGLLSPIKAFAFMEQCSTLIYGNSGTTVNYRDATHADFIDHIANGAFVPPGTGIHPPPVPHPGLCPDGSDPEPIYTSEHDHSIIYADNLVCDPPPNDTNCSNQLEHTACYNGSPQVTHGHVSGYSCAPDVLGLNNCTSNGGTTTCCAQSCNPSNHNTECYDFIIGPENPNPDGDPATADACFECVGVRKAGFEFCSKQLKYDAAGAGGPIISATPGCVFPDYEDCLYYADVNGNGIIDQGDIPLTPVMDEGQVGMGVAADGTVGTCPACSYGSAFKYEECEVFDCDGTIYVPNTSPPIALADRGGGLVCQKSEAEVANSSNGGFNLNIFAANAGKNIRWSADEPNILAKLPVPFESAGHGYKNQELVFLSEVRDIEAPFLEPTIPFPLSQATLGIRPSLEFQDSNTPYVGFLEIPENDENWQPNGTSAQQRGVNQAEVSYYNTDGQQKIVPEGAVAPSNVPGGEDPNDYPCAGQNGAGSYIKCLQQLVEDDKGALAKKRRGKQRNELFRQTVEQENSTFKAGTKRFTREEVLRGVITSKVPSVSDVAGFDDEEKRSMNLRRGIDMSKLQYDININNLQDRRFGKGLRAATRAFRNDAELLDTNNLPSSDSNPWLRVQDAIVGARGCDIGGWYELMLYQARCIRWFGLNCICDYDKTFIDGSDEAYVHTQAGAIFNAVEPFINKDKQVDFRDINIEWPLMFRGFAGPRFGLWKNGVTNNWTANIKVVEGNEVSPRLWDKANAQINSSSDNIAINQANYNDYTDDLNSASPKVRESYGKPLSYLTNVGKYHLDDEYRGLDEAQVGDIIIYDETLLTPTTDHPSPDAAGSWADGKNHFVDARYRRHLAYVESIFRDESGQITSITESTQDFGKNLDTCGTTDRWGIKTTRQIFHPSHKDKKEYGPCDDPDWKQCIEYNWYRIKLFRPAYDHGEIINTASTNIDVSTKPICPLYEMIDGTNECVELTGCSGGGCGICKTIVPPVITSDVAQYHVMKYLDANIGSIAGDLSGLNYGNGIDNNERSILEQNMTNLQKIESGFWMYQQLGKYNAKEVIEFLIDNPDARFGLGRCDPPIEIRNSNIFRDNSNPLEKPESLSGNYNDEVFTTGTSTPSQYVRCPSACSHPNCIGHNPDKCSGFFSGGSTDPCETDPTTC